MGLRAEKNTSIKKVIESAKLAPVCRHLWALASLMLAAPGIALAQPAVDGLFYQLRAGMGHLVPLLPEAQVLDSEISRKIDDLDVRCQ